MVRRLKIKNKNKSLIKNYIRKGIFQGETFSPLWFCLAMNPFSWTLNQQSNYGYLLKSKEISTRITHTFFINDFKLFVETVLNLHHLLKTVQGFSKDIRLEFGIDMSINSSTPRSSSGCR